MPALRSAICLALIVVSVLASSVFAAVPQPAPVAPAAASAAPGDTRWDDRFAMEFGRRFNDNSAMEFYAAAEFNGELYVGGSFGNAPSFNTLNYIARWNGRQWNAVGAGDWIYNSNVYAQIYDLAVHENTLYATGIFTTAAGVAANNIASWDGQQWQAVGGGLNGAGHSLASYDGDLYVGGDFSTAGGVAAEGVARWDGAAWHAVGAGLQSNPTGPGDPMSGVGNLIVTPHGLYAGGGFDRSGAQELRTLALWDDSQWSAVIPELSGGIFSMDWHNGALYAGGALSIGGATPTTGALLRWDGTQAQYISSGLTPASAVWTVRSVANELYVTQREKFYRWNGASMEPFGPGPEQLGRFVRDIVAYDNTLHIVGSMGCATAACDARFVLALDGARWRGLGNGVDTSYYGGHVAVLNDDVYLVGARDSDWLIMGSERITLGKWDGSQWTNAGLLPGQGRVTALTGDGSRLYVAAAVRSSAQYTSTVYLREGDSWTALPGAFNGEINTLVYTGGALYAGGYFTAVNTLAATSVARWDGTAWSGLGNGSLYNVMALAIHDDMVYAAGCTVFYPFPSDCRGRATRWDGSGWTQIATTDSLIEAIAVTPDGAVYMGGHFSTINDLPIAHFARWRAGAWEAAAADLTGPVMALDVAPDGALYVGGDFASQSIPGLKHIARYDGTWQPLGSGVDGAVTDLEVTDAAVYLSGRLTRAGDKSSEGVAIWHTAVNSAPQAVADTATTTRGQAVDIAVLGNDTDADQDGLTITGVTTPSHGVAQVIGAAVRYTPAANFAGTDSFSYTASDGVGGTSSATVTVTVAAPVTRMFLPTVVR
jgi:trimeric autotransporter adhesin